MAKWSSSGKDRNVLSSPPQTYADGLEPVQEVSSVHPLILCYDGSDDARYAIAPEKGVGLAREAGLDAEPLAVEADGPIWETIIETAERERAAVIALGSRGRTGLRSLLLGSVSGAVVQHAHRPTLVIHRPSETI